ncbi:flippase-like domain-containing protein, partial [Patescibacteria group bacterium]|nr:flippase-like domain-containing protein [Patescibacteria group bacterium]
MIKKVLGSKIFRLVLSATLLYFAFRRVDVVGLANDLARVPVWFVVVILVYSFLGMLLGSARWSLLVLGKISLKDVWCFSKVNMIGGFYGLFLSSPVGGDFFKWAYLHKKYKEISKARLGFSVIVDRTVGLSAFAMVAFFMMI